MTTLLKHAVSGNRRRWTDEVFDLDLSYITERVIAMGLPSTGLEAYARNDINEVRNSVVLSLVLASPFVV